MSFGWSAGDIVAALTLAYNLIEALDSIKGAAHDYREAVSFLRDLKCTLYPLETFTAWHAYPKYGRDIREQVAHIKEPVGNFLKEVLKYEPTLGVKANEGHSRHVFRKLQWYMFMEKKVLGLKKKIESHMRVIDTLLQQLTLDILYTTQQNLPRNLRALFEETLRPSLVLFLRNNLKPLNSELLTNIQDTQAIYYKTLVSKLEDNYDSLLSDISAIKEQISNSHILQQQIHSVLNNANPTVSRKPTLEDGRRKAMEEGQDESYLFPTTALQVEDPGSSKDNTESAYGVLEEAYENLWQK